MPAEIHIDSLGEERRLGLIPPNLDAKKRRARRKTFGQLLAERGLPLVPRNQYRDLLHDEELNPKFFVNQRNCSGCVGWSEAGATMITRHRRGMKFERLSGAFTYAHINGGQDGGAMILDALESGEKYGHCLESEFDYPKLFLKQIPESAKQSALTRQSELAYPIDSFDEFWTAILLGFCVQHGVCVDGNFERFDANGVSAARGRYANHSVYSSGVKIVGGKPVSRMPNSWGEVWGPFGNGTCYLSEAGIILDGDAFVHVSGEWLEGDLPTPA